MTFASKPNRRNPVFFEHHTDGFWCSIDDMPEYFKTKHEMYLYACESDRELIEITHENEPELRANGDFERVFVMNRTVIDYVSFSGSPLLLERCKEMAKQRFCLEQINEFESQNAVAIKHREQTKIMHFAENLAQVLGCVESENFANRDLYFAPQG